MSLHHGGRSGAPSAGLWPLLRLASPQLPIGGYSYSQGLETALEQGAVRDAESAFAWLSDQLQLNLARFEGPLLAELLRAAARGDWPALDDAAERHRASRETRELAQESRQMGFSLAQLLEALPELDQPARAWLGRQTEPNLAAAWALAARAWDLDLEQALGAWLWSWLENQLAVLMKALPLGQLAAQKLTSRLLPELDRACAAALANAAPGSAPFGLALASMAHESQYSRLFRS
ncbi:urease accessory protein UreF [Pseudomonas panipatensis]|uniref:Urease accessory protein UreF n=1 Tax=Pseudomonas panipatensis TaxID=428992 RepID=A0A1G8HAB9_9PSED|nr:urease accessory UreF family protein [Pseudomonas panipatensis]SDI03618.1 urease accessory protein [Pseudomonas panipatensis]SMP57394.1 urease accessory protein [Pseudomonas panipatensis]